MPNWVQTQVYARNTESAKKMAALLKGKDTYGEEKEITFNAIVPMPDDVYRGDIGRDAPANNWYSWRIDHWGTKWDAHDPHVGDDYVEFQTAWSFALPVMVELAKKLGETILCIYADEGIPENSGVLLINKDGECGKFSHANIVNQVIWNGGYLDTDELFECEEYLDFEEADC